MGTLPCVAKNAMKNAMKKRYVALSCFHTVSSRDRSAIQPRRKERSSAQLIPFGKGWDLARRFNGCGCRGGRSEAQHNAPRQGPALPSTACQISHNVIPTSCQRSGEKKKKNAMLNAQLYFLFYPASDLHTLTPCLKGRGRPWETLHLNK